MMRSFGYDEHLLSSRNRSVGTSDLFGVVIGTTPTCEYLDLSLRDQMDKNGNNRLPTPNHALPCRATSDHRPSARQIDVPSRKIYL